MVWVALVPLAGSLAACNPSAEDCHDLMPVEAGPAIPAPTPGATRGCKTEQDGVTIQVEAVRRNMSWERGRIWIDGVETPESDLASTLLAARARHAATDLASRANRALRDTAKSLRDTFHAPPPPSKPPPPQP